jgi:hypothetical protein
MRIFTIGYEQTTTGDLIAALQAAGVQRVVDIRAVAASRRPGFSKTALGGALQEAGIAYEHLRALGTPKEGRDAAKRGDRVTLERVYAGQLELTPRGHSSAPSQSRMMSWTGRRAAAWTSRRWRWRPRSMASGAGAGPNTAMFSTRGAVRPIRRAASVASRQVLR